MDRRPDRAVGIGIFGGTFDPPHVGHTTVAADVADALALERVLWVPANASPFKVDERQTAAEVRLELVRAAVEADPRFEVETLELSRPAPSYTVDTLEALRARHPEATLHLIVGADQFRELPRWRSPGRIVELARLAVMNRGTDDASSDIEAVARSVPGVAERTTFVRVRAVDVSSTDVRAAVARGEDPGRWVSEPVAELIRARGLYRR